MNEVSISIINVIKQIPFGFVCTYAWIAEAAGCPGAARRVARILHTCTAKYELPWHRVIKSDGCIALAPGAGLEEQKELLRSEGIEINRGNRIDLNEYGYRG